MAVLLRFLIVTQCIDIINTFLMSELELYVIVSRGVVQLAALVAVLSGMGRADQRATAGRLMSGSSLIWLMVSSLM